MAKSHKKKKVKKKPGRKKQKSLNEQQKKFCRYYVDCNNLADAWMKAGYKCKNRDNARKDAYNFLQTNTYAETYIASLRKRLEEKTDKTAEDAIKELAKIGFSNIQDYVGDDNQIVDISQIPREDAAAIESIQTDIRHDSGDSKGYTEKVKLKCHSKEAALKEFLNRVQGLPKQRIEHSGVVGTREISKEEMAELVKERTIPCDDAIAS